MKNRSGTKKKEKTQTMRHYPGKAVDATLSMEQNSAMGVLYEANWLNAQHNIRNSGINNYYHNHHSNGISSLGQYQRQLEQVKAYEEKTKDANITRTIRELSGYKPSTLRRKHRKQYIEWDVPAATNTTTGNIINTGNNDEHLTKNGFHFIQPNHSQTTEFNTYVNLSGTVKQKNQKNNLKRSQTVIMEHSTSSKNNNNVEKTSSNEQSSRGTLDIRDLFQRRQRIKANNIKCDSKEAEEYEEYLRGNSGGMKKPIVELTKHPKSFNLKKSINDYEIIDFDDDSGYKSPSRIPHDYETIEFGLNGKKVENGRMTSYSRTAPPPPLPNTTTTAAAAVVSVNRAKSVRISASPVKIIQQNGDSVKANGKPEKKSESSSGFKKFIYNTISAGTRYPKEFLKHINGSSNGNGNGNTSTTTNDTNLNGQSIEIHQPVPSIRKSLKPSIIPRQPPSPPTEQPPPPPPPQQQQQQSIQIVTSPLSQQSSQQIPQPRKQGSSSSVDSDEQFIIPRPRLIVPVHTYARKRRTGNLVDKGLESVGDNLNEDDDQGKVL